MKKILCFAMALALCAGTALADGGVQDGKYVTTGRGHEGIVHVATTFQDGKIQNVEVLTHDETVGIGDYAVNVMPGRIVENQSVAVDTVSGCTMTSYAITSAVKEAIKQAGGDVADFSAKPEKTVTESSVEETVDLVIMGAGTSGLIAGNRALEKGLNVLIFEKMDIPGGAMPMTYSGLMAAGSDMQNAYAGEKAPTVEQYVALIKSMVNPENAVRGEDPNAAYELGPIAMPVTADGFKPKTYAFSSIDVNYQLGINADTKYPEICMQILNYIYSDESIIDANYGEEGVTFDYVDGEPVLNENIPTVLNNYQTPDDPIDIDEYKAAWLGIFNVVTDTDLYALTYYGPYSYPGYKLYSENEWLMDLDPVIPASYFTTEEEAEKSDIMTALSEYCNAQIQDFIEGTRPLTEEEYAKFQDECLNEYGAARWCEIMNTAYAAWKG